MQHELALLRTELLKLKAASLAIALDRAMARIAAGLKAYDPAQPRVPGVILMAGNGWEAGLQVICEVATVRPHGNGWPPQALLSGLIGFGSTSIVISASILSTMRQKPL